MDYKDLSAIWLKIIMLSVIGVLVSCAVITRPEGGDDDEEGPVVLVEESTNNYQTNYYPEQIILKFNEWVQLSNPVKEIFVSPPLAYPLQISERGKVVTIKFHENEELKSNTTYQINLGKSVVDFTARNPIDNYSFIFSTGPIIDSLSIAGRVKEEGSLKAAAEILVMLYSNLSDTAFLKLKPDYITRTDKAGSFNLKNLRMDTFQIFALEDQNVSFTYDLEAERIAFSDSLLFIKDTLINQLNLLLFDEEDKLRIGESNQKTKGLITIGFNKEPKDIQIQYLSDSTARRYVETNKDSVYFWHTDLSENISKLVVLGLEKPDTLEFRRATALMSNKAFELLELNKRLAPRDSIILKWNKPILEVDTSRIYLKDSTQNYPIEYFSVIGRELKLKYNLPANSKFKLQLDSAAVTDWYQINSDSTEINLSTMDPTTLGKIKLHFINPDSSQYLIDIFKGANILSQQVLTQEEEITLQGLEAGAYKLIIVKDENRDNKWTAGQLQQKTLPEIRKEYKLEELKPGWDLETEVNLQELFDGTKG